MKKKSAHVKKAKTAVGTVKSASADSLMVAGKEKGPQGRRVDVRGGFQDRHPEIRKSDHRRRSEAG